MRGVVKASKSPEDQLSYNKQVVDSLVAALRTDLYPQGRKPLDAIVADGGKLASYAAYSLIDAEFAMKNDEPGANVLANQKKWMADLEDFLAKFPSSDEVPAVLLHLANANEFNAEEEKARQAIRQVVESYPATDPGKKAAGALRRLDLVGKSLAIKGTGLQNETVDSSQYRGKTGPGRLLGELGLAGQARPSRPDQGLREVPRARARDHRCQPRQRAWGLDAFLKEHHTGLAADLRGRRHGEPPGRRLRHHLVADHVPGRREEKS